jgi:hypothetical protein
MEVTARLRNERLIDVIETQIGKFLSKNEHMYQLFEYVAVGLVDDGH